MPLCSLPRGGRKAPKPTDTTETAVQDPRFDDGTEAGDRMGRNDNSEAGMCTNPRGGAHLQIGRGPGLKR